MINFDRSGVLDLPLSDLVEDFGASAGLLGGTLVTLADVCRY